MSATAVSAPGKVMLAGGYLVVDRAYTCLVFGLSSRMHVIVEDYLQNSELKQHKIVVRSPQFEDAEWHYTYALLRGGGGVEVASSNEYVKTAYSSKHLLQVIRQRRITAYDTMKRCSSVYDWRSLVLSLTIVANLVTPRNKFVETALAYTLTYVSETIPFEKIGSTFITILADDDYYSQSQKSMKCAQNEHSRFKYFNIALSDAHKTGLGSSAALVTALTAALFGHYLSPAVIRKGWTFDSSLRMTIHNLAQAAHCTAQGKIGSGFDVAAAVYGSCIYRRFSPSILERIGDLGSMNFSLRLKDTIDDGGTNKIWDTFINKSIVKMPQGLRLVMCDVDCGSETPGMVKRVFNWKEEKQEEALLLWKRLQNGNEDLAAELLKLSQTRHKSFDNLRNIILTIRSLIQEMSVKTGVPIEPKEQTQLLDACSNLPGIVGGVVPGAGGYDALAFVVEDNEAILSSLSQYLETYQVKQDEAQGAIIGKVRLLGVKHEMNGLENENVSLYRGWLQKELLG